MANDYNYEDDFFDDDDKWKPLGAANHVPPLKNSASQDYKAKGSSVVHPDKRSIKSKTETTRSSVHHRSKTYSRNNSTSTKNSSTYNQKNYQSESEESLSDINDQYNNSKNQKSLKQSNGKNNADTYSFAPSHYDYEDTFVAESDHTHTPDGKRITAKNKLLIKKPKFRQKSNATPDTGTYQRLLSAKNSKIHEFSSRVRELENALQEVHNENKLLKRLQRIQEKEITNFQSDQEEIPRLMQQHSAEMKSVKMLLDKARVKHQKTWKRLLEVESLLREEKARSEKLKQIVDSRNLKERYELDKKLSEANESIEAKDKRIMELESHLSRVDKNTNKQLGWEKGKTKELQALVEELRNKNVKLEFSLKEKEKELSIRDIYRQRAIHEPKTQLVPVGAQSSSSSPGLTASTGNLAPDSSRKPKPPPPRRLPPQSIPRATYKPPNKPTNTAAQQATTTNPNPENESQPRGQQPVLENKDTFITQINMENNDKSPAILDVETAVGNNKSPRDQVSPRRQENIRASDQRRKEQEAELDRQHAAQQAELGRLKQEEAKRKEEERLVREAEIKRRQAMMQEAEEARQRKQETERKRLAEQRSNFEAERVDLDKQLKEAEADDRALRQALEAQQKQRASMERREKQTWQDAEEKRLKDQVLAKTNSRKLDWLSPSPEDSDDDAAKFKNKSKNPSADLLDFGSAKRTTNGRVTKKLDLLFSDDEDDGLNLLSKNKHPEVVEKLHNGLPTHEVSYNSNNRHRAGVGSMAPFMMGEASNDFLFAAKHPSKINPHVKVGGNNGRVVPGRHNGNGGGFQQTHLFGVDSPDPIF